MWIPSEYAQGSLDNLHAPQGSSMRKKKIKNYTLFLLIYLGHLLAWFSIFKIWNIRTFLRSFSFNSFYYLLPKRVLASSHERCRLREVMKVYGLVVKLLQPQ